MNITVTTIGRATRDPEMKQSKTGKEFLSFGLAVNVGFGDKQKTEFIECVAKAELGHRIINAKVKKGSLITVYGSLFTSEYEKNGEKRFSLNLSLFDWSYLPVKKQDDDKNAQPANSLNSEQQTNNDYGNDYESLNLDDEELPF